MREQESRGVAASTGWVFDYLFFRSSKVKKKRIRYECPAPRIGPKHLWALFLPQQSRFGVSGCVASIRNTSKVVSTTVHCGFYVISSIPMIWNLLWLIFVLLSCNVNPKNAWNQWDYFPKTDFLCPVSLQKSVIRNHSQSMKSRNNFLVKSVYCCLKIRQLMTFESIILRRWSFQLDFVGGQCPRNSIIEQSDP